MNLLTAVRDIIRFSKAHRRIYIYGAGAYGEVLHHFLTSHKISVDGFLISFSGANTYLNLPVYVFNDISASLTEDDGIILALNDKHCADVTKSLVTAKAGILKISQDVFEFLFHFFSNYSNAAMRRFAMQYPAQPFNGTDGWKNILVVRIDRMGDMIWTSAFFRELRGNFPNARITALIDKSNMMLMEACPYVDRVIGYDESKFQYEWVNWWKMFLWTKTLANEYFANENYDVVFLPRGQMEQYMISNVFFAIHSGAKVRITNWFDTADKVDKTFRRAMKPLFSVIAEHNRPKHEVSKILDMLRAIGKEVRDEETELWSLEDLKSHTLYEDEIKKQKISGKKILILGITGRDAPQRGWNPQKFKILIENLNKHHSTLFLLCGDKAICGIAARILTSNCIDLTGKTNLHQLMNIIKLSDIYVGADTGLMHMAAALKKPCVEISIHFLWGDDNGISSPLRCGPWKTKSIILQPEKALDEICAEKGYCVHTTPHCINTISVERVQAAVEKMLRDL